MSFKFQINKDVKFTRNEKFLNIAEKYKPKLVFQTHSAQRCIEIAKEDTEVRTVGQNLPISDLSARVMGKNDYLILDFGNHFVGHFSVGITRHGSFMDAPLTLKLQFAERPEELAYEAKNYNGWLSSSWIPEEVIHIDQLPTRLEMPRRYSFRYVKITVLDTSPKWQISLNAPTIISESAVDESKLPELKMADHELQKIGTISIKTLAECMQSVFEDGPKRDQRLWLGDLQLQALANYCTFHQNSLVKRCLYLFAGVTTSDGKLSANIFTNNQVNADDTFLFDYSVFFVSCLKDYLENSDDKQTAIDLYQTAKRQIDLASEYVDGDGKLTLPSEWPVFVDWGDDSDKSTAAQAIYIKKLQDFMSLNALLGFETSENYVQLLNALVSYSVNDLYSQKDGLFTSNGELNIYSQIWMALAKVLPKDKNIELMNAAYKKFFPIQNVATPYMYHFIVEALLQNEMREEGVQLIKDYWGKMVSMGADTFWEAFKPDEPNYSPYGSPLVNSYCHAWACTPIYLIKKYNL
ncbi:Alfa-L-rhamnosidase [Lactiplantibacillus pentosus KCA1]|nr:family 78 glycoside hydrolase catalytic domain [Lactiplantibacillus pentosus]EIW13051.1 Alfa-L-rhamnosidase [Lactiplantibacillus pentosus KCA1]